MRVFLDTNVLVSNLLFGGVCAEVVEIVLRHHTSVTGDYVIREAKGVLADRFGVPESLIEEYLDRFRRHHIEPLPEAPYKLPISDLDDPWIVASAVNARADLLVTGDKPLRSADDQVPELRIISPREFLELHRS